MRGKGLPEVIGAPCCRFRNTGVTHPNLALLDQVVKVTQARHGWRFHILQDKLDKPTWRVYVIEESLTKSELAQAERKVGPVQTLKEVLVEFSKNK